MHKRREKRTRLPNFTAWEESLLLILVKKYAHVVESKKTNSRTTKIEVWEEIAKEFAKKVADSCDPLIKRDAKGLREKYNQMKKYARKRKMQRSVANFANQIKEMSEHVQHADTLKFEETDGDPLQNDDSELDEEKDEPASILEAMDPDEDTDCILNEISNNLAEKERSKLSVQTENTVSFTRGFPNNKDRHFSINYSEDSTLQRNSHSYMNSSGDGAERRNCKIEQIHASEKHEWEKRQAALQTKLLEVNLEGRIKEIKDNLQEAALRRQLLEIELEIKLKELEKLNSH